MSRIARVAHRSSVHAALIGGALVALAAVLGASQATWPRHLLVIPVMAGALRFGLLGGVLTAFAASLTYAPLFLPDVEATGFTAATADSVAILLTLGLIGTLAGALQSDARHQETRSATQLAVQSAAAAGRSLTETLDHVQETLAARIPHAGLAVVLRDGDTLLVAAPDGTVAVPGPASTVTTVLGTGRARFIADAEGHGRVRRVFVAPLAARGVTIGALAIERLGEISVRERTSLLGLAGEIGLALDNARLAAAERRFAGHLTAEVARATSRLQAMDRAKSTLVATASHELRTPLTALRGFSELLVARRFPPETVQRFGTILRRETDRLTALVDDLLDLSKLERGIAPVLRRRRLDLAAAVGETVELFRRGTRAHRVRCVVAEGLPHVDADPDAIDRVLKNLLANAVKYSPLRSTIDVRVHAMPAGAVTIEIADEGRDIPAEAHVHIFEPYYRAPNAAVAAGVGIGLAVVKTLVEAHGGTVSAQSVVGRGTRMTVVLPAVP